MSIIPVPSSSFLDYYWLINDTLKKCINFSRVRIQEHFQDPFQEGFQDLFQEVFQRGFFRKLAVENSYFLYIRSKYDHYYVHIATQQA